MKLGFKLKTLAFIKSKELDEGIKIEKEHKDLIEKIKADIKKHRGKLTLTDKEIYAIIAKKHLKEKSNYYKLLEKYVEKDDNE